MIGLFILLTVNALMIYTPRNVGLNILEEKTSRKYIVIQNPYCGECLEEFSKQYKSKKPPIIMMISSIKENYIKVKFRTLLKKKFPNSQVYFCESKNLINKYQESPILIEVKNGKIKYEDYKKIFFMEKRGIRLNPIYNNYFD